MPGRRWSQTELDEVRMAYAIGVPVEEVAASVGRTEKAVREAAKRLGLRRLSNPRTIDDSTFSRRDPETAYWAGFLMADGCVNHRRKTTVRIQVHLSSQDVDHLRTFANFIGHTGKLVPTSSGGLIMSVNSRRMADDLALWGVVPNKTYVGTIPNDIPPELMPHYLRGLIDGDGGIYDRRRADEKHEWSLELTSNEAVIHHVASLLQHELDIAPSLRSRCNHNTSHHTWKLRVGRKEDVRRLLSWLQYDGSGPSMRRKRDVSNRLIGGQAGQDLQKH
jgi:hypothetical protein